jgi:hypothetical protein
MRRRSLCACSDRRGVAIAKRAQSLPVTRVSSQAMQSASRSTRSARAETSSRLPIGVATT